MRLNIFSKALLVTFAVAALAAAPAESTGIIDFDQLVDSGNISYDGVGGALIGTGIGFEFIKGVDTPFNDGVSIACDECLLDFMTGANLNEGAISSWAGGGTFVLRGAVPALGLGPNSEILSGTFGLSSALVSPGFGQVSFLGEGQDIKAEELVDFFYGPGQGAVNNKFIFANTEIAADAEFIGNGGFTGEVTEADLTNKRVPEPGTTMLLLLGIAGIAAARRRS